MTTALQKKTTEVEAFLSQSQDRIQAILPKHLSPERMIKLAVHACEKNPKLLDCTKESLLSALIEASECGLEPVGVMGEAALIPYGKQATFQPMYKGLAKKARDTGKVLDIQPDVVCENDEFEFYRATPHDHLFHRPALNNPGQVVGAYCRAILDSGVQKIIYYPREKLERIRKTSKDPNGMLWGNNFDEAAKKTVVKAICKTLPQSRELATAIDIDNRAETDAYDQPETEAKPMQMPRRKSNPIDVPAVEVEKEIEPPECPDGHGPMRLQPAGKKGNRKYPAFYGCTQYREGCKHTKRQADWIAEREGEVTDA